MVHVWWYMWGGTTIFELMSAGTKHATLERTLSLPAAVMLGMGAMVGTGAFVGLALAAGYGGRWLAAAVIGAAVLAWCNAMSSAALAAAHPVAGGTYEYAYRTLSGLGAWSGRAAGWMFLCAKSASCSAAALALAEGVLMLLRVNPAVGRTPLALAMLCGIAAFAFRGVRASAALTAVLVAVAIAGLGAFVVTAEPLRVISASGNAAPPLAITGMSVLYATALVFVAFTGYGRLATLGEEVREPQRTIPQAIHITLAAAAAVYLAVAMAITLVCGPQAMAWIASYSGQPLAEAARLAGHPLAGTLVLFGALTALGSVMLNLLLGLSRVVLAMARRGDLPTALAVLSARQLPHRALAVAAVGCGVLTAVGSIRLAWTISAMTVLIYYAITNVCALTLPGGAGTRAVRVVGLIGCVGLAGVVVGWQVWR